LTRFPEEGPLIRGDAYSTETSGQSFNAATEGTERTAGEEQQTHDQQRPRKSQPSNQHVRVPSPHRWQPARWTQRRASARLV